MRQSQRCTEQRGRAFQAQETGSAETPRWEGTWLIKKQHKNSCGWCPVSKARRDPRCGWRGGQRQGKVSVAILGVLKFIKLGGPLLGEGRQNYKYEVTYKSGYLFISSFTELQLTRATV